MGNDHVAINSCGIENLKYLCSLDIWNPKTNLEKQVMEGRYKALIEHYNLWTGHVFAHLGGYYYGDNHYDTPEYTQKS